MAALAADEGVLVFDNRMAGSGAEPTPECPSDDACERLFVAGPGLTCSAAQFGPEQGAHGLSLS